MQFGPTGYKPPIQEAERSFSSDPFASEVQKTMRYIFGGVLKPSTPDGEFMMLPWVELYKCKSHLFDIQGSFHSNGINDPLHLSVTYSPYLGPKVHFHIYGYYREEFMIHRVTMLVHQTPLELATYEKKSFVE
jgi:hypothetical protein